MLPPNKSLLVRDGGYEEFKTFPDRVPARARGAFGSARLNFQET
jgi:hypothetical protein